MDEAFFKLVEDEEGDDAVLTDSIASEFAELLLAGLDAEFLRLLLLALLNDDADEFDKDDVDVVGSFLFNELIDGVLLRFDATC